MSGDICKNVDENRLRTDIEKTAEFGQLTGVEGTGRTVLTGSEADKQARQYLFDRLEDAGLTVRVDQVGNISGRWVPDGVATSAEPIASGSHLDSVVHGGIFDGVLGVYGALESVRAMQDADVTPKRPIEVISFTEEEGGRFSDGVLGSSVASGDQDVETALRREDATGVTLGEALAGIGCKGTGRINASKWDAWVELHIEQGSRLDRAGISTGIVTDITGTIRSHVEIVGESNHAGTTLMDDRRDALAAASDLTLAVESIANEVIDTVSETAVATVGQQSVEPNSINVIPGRVHLGIDIRDVQAESLTEIVMRIRHQIRRIEADRDVEIAYDQPYEIAPTSLSPRCVSRIRDAAATIGIQTRDLHSGAGHDTMQIADVTDVGLIFAPSVDGMSHSPQEWTTWSDCTESTRVLAQSIWELAT